MVNKIAIDWDEKELRLVAAQCGGRSVKVTDASVIPVKNEDVNGALRAAISERGLANTETLIAIGRGKAELRELQLPPVPSDELPEMVRFQAIKNFATAGESAIVDFLVTNRGENSVEMIAAAVGPQTLSSIQETCGDADLPVKRISLRPLAAAALYLINRPAKGSGDTVLIDLLTDDAEIVVARDGQVIFVRTVRMPGGEAARARALAGELRRSLVACGSSGSLDRVVLWGRESVHSDEIEMLAEASGSRVEAINPFDLVDVDRGAEIPDHVGRLAPLVGLLAADDSDADRLVDFLNPRQRHIEAPNPYRKIAMIGAPIAAALLLAFVVYRQMKGLDQQIADLKSSNAEMKEDVDRATVSIARTETVDKFLDGDVNWLSEIRRMANRMPPAEEMIVRSVSADAASGSRGGGGTLKVEGAAIDPSIIDTFETALRDETHRVKGDGATQAKTDDAYRWEFTEEISVAGNSVRDDRYVAMNLASASGDSPAEEAVADASDDAIEEESIEEESIEEDSIEEESIEEEAQDETPSDSDQGDEEAPPPDGANDDSPEPSAEEPVGGGDEIEQSAEEDSGQGEPSPESAEQTVEESSEVQS